MMDLKHETIRGIKWSGLGTFLLVATQTAVIAVLGRILDPADYGLLAIANVFIQLAGHFSQMGLGPALVQRQRIDDCDIRASFTLAALLGISFACLVALSAPLAEFFFKSARVGRVVQWLSLSFVLGGFSLTSVSILRREMRFKALAMLDFCSYAIGNGAVAIACAAAGLGVWSLVAGILAQQALTTVGAYLLVRHSLVPVFAWSVYRKSLRLGAHYSLNSILDFLYIKVEVLFLGRLFAENIIGLFDRAYRLTHMPVQHIATSIGKVMFPAFSRLQERPAELARTFMMTFSSLGLLTTGVCAGMAVAAREIILVVLGSKWEEAVIPLRILAVAVPVHYLISVQGLLLDGMGKLGARTKSRLLGIAFKVLLIAACAGLGFHGVLFGIGVALLFQMLLLSFYVVKHAGIRAAALARACLVLAANACVVGAATAGMTWGGRMLEVSNTAVLGMQVVGGGMGLLCSLAFVVKCELAGVQVADLKSFLAAVTTTREQA